MDIEYKWDDETRLEMIDRSKNYENQKEYQYGYFDGYQKYFRESKENELLELIRIISLTPSFEEAKNNYGDNENHWTKKVENLIINL